MSLDQHDDGHIMSELEAREAWDRRDYEGARHIAGKAMVLALESGNDTAWWRMGLLQAECLRHEGNVAASEAAAGQLETHPLTIGCPQLSARVSTLRATALQGLGRLPEAVSHATSAVQHAEKGGEFNVLLVEAENVLIAALAESGEIEKAWRQCEVLDRLLHAGVDTQTAGNSYWAIGNVAYIRGDVLAATGYHRLAADHLSPTNDLDVWARFNKASAAMRLAAGVVEPETLECIQRAEMGLSIVGGTERDHLQIQLIRAHWQVLTGDFGAAVGSLKAICASTSVLAIQTLGESRLLLGQALEGLQEQEESVGNLLASEQLFLEAGAPDRASYVRALIDAS